MSTLAWQNAPDDFVVQQDEAWYSLWDEIDFPSDEELPLLENIRQRGILESKRRPVQEKYYIVCGGRIFVCHSSQFSMTKKVLSKGEVVRDILLRDARMVVYDNEFRKVDR